jgi:hypothetical protein
MLPALQEMEMTANIIQLKTNPTICADCKNCVKKNEANIWYNYHCGAIFLPETIDFVTGDTYYIGHGNGDPRNLTSEKHPYCRDVNDGSCRYFERKGWFK